MNEPVARASRQDGPQRAGTAAAGPLPGQGAAALTRVLVAGATGHLGRQLVAQLHERGCRVRVLIRRAGQAAALPRAAEVFTGQVTDPATLRGVADGIDTVFSTVGITRQRDRVSYQQVDYGGNLALLREAERAGVRHFTYVASSAPPGCGR